MLNFLFTIWFFVMGPCALVSLSFALLQEMATNAWFALGIPVIIVLWYVWIMAIWSMMEDLKSEL